ncbi:MAG: hypothetical protein AAGA18_07785 [Verrucomicrobiota bacterium]
MRKVKSVAGSCSVFVKWNSDHQNRELLLRALISDKSQTPFFATMEYEKLVDTAPKEDPPNTT